MRGDAKIELCEEFEYFTSGSFYRNKESFCSDLLRPNQHKFHSGVKHMRSSVFAISCRKTNSKLLKTE